MFEVGFTELLLIFGLALVVLGPEKLPKLAQQVGRWVGRARAMARQFRDQLEEEAHNLETKMNIDPGIDTSLEPKPAKPAPVTPASAATGVAPAAPPEPEPETEPEENFYPPDHHMHPAQRAAENPADSPGTQSEMDLTTPRERDPRAGP
jgi:sec-independent protein translocase protein TatB